MLNPAAVFPRLSGQLWTGLFHYLSPLAVPYVTRDSDVSMMTHMTKNLSSCFASLSDTKHVSVSLQTIADVACYISGLVMAWLWQCDISRSTRTLTGQLQSVLNALLAQKHDLVTPFYWLWMPQQIKF